MYQSWHLQIVCWTLHAFFIIENVIHRTIYFEHSLLSWLSLLKILHEKIILCAIHIVWLCAWLAASVFTEVWLVRDQSELLMVIFILRQINLHSRLWRRIVACACDLRRGITTFLAIFWRRNIMIVRWRSLYWSVLAQKKTKNLTELMSYLIFSINPGEPIKHFPC